MWADVAPFSMLPFPAWCPHLPIPWELCKPQQSSRQLSRTLPPLHMLNPSQWTPWKYLSHRNPNSVVLISEGNKVMTKKGKRNYHVGAPYTKYFTSIVLFNPPNSLSKKCHSPQLTGEDTEALGGWATCPSDRCHSSLPRPAVKGHMGVSPELRFWQHVSTQQGTF